MNEFKVFMFYMHNILVYIGWLLSLSVVYVK